MKPLFLSFEGIDGAGKSSHVEWLAEHLRGKGVDVVVTREIGGTPVGEALRNLVLTQDMLPATEVLLAYAARIEHVSKVIQPALQAGKWVLSDRYIDSTYAFQGAGRGVPMNEIEEIDYWCTLPTPDVTFYFDVPTQVGVDRVKNSRDELDRIEKMNTVFHQRVRQGYEMRIAHDPARFAIFDGTQTIEDIRARIASFSDVLIDQAHGRVTKTQGFFSRIFTPAASMRP